MSFNRTWAPLMAALVLAGAAALHAQDADRPANPFKADPAAIAQGKSTFDGPCAACHGSAGTGGRGPALNSGRFARASDDYELFTVIHDGVRGSEMPAFAALPANDIWKVVSYIRSLSAPPAPIPGTTPAAVTGNAARGEQLFFAAGGCSGCHEISGRGADIGPDLSGEGTREPAAIAAAILHPVPQRGAMRWVSALTSTGQRVRGNIVAEDTFTALVRTDAGALERVDRLSASSFAEDPAVREGMKAIARLPATDRADLTAFLAAQKGRAVSGALQPTTSGSLTGQRLLRGKAEPGNWATYWGGYDGLHFSELTQIDTRNVGQLQAKWAALLPGASQLKSTPLVIDGVMYVSGSPGEVQALDARTGLQMWRFVRKQDVTNPYQINPTNRGVAVLDGRVFVTTLDNLVIALDARTGRELWERRSADTLDGFEMTGAPLALPGKLIVGMGGGEFALRGYLEAYDPATGERLWRTYTVPAPGEPGNETWAGESWKTGGGGTWLTGSYDAELDTLYWTVGNPAPSFNPLLRAGDNLYTNSVLALNPATGKIKWHYQFTPADSHDWDSQEGLVLTDAVIDGKPRKLILHADRNGFYYVLDRTNGAFVRAVAFVTQTWNDGFDLAGRPIVRPSSIVTEAGTITWPATGGTNWQAPSYDAVNRRFFVAYSDSAVQMTSENSKIERGKQYVAGRRSPAPGVIAAQGVAALDGLSGKVLWRFPLARGSLAAGVLGTRGGLLVAASADGNVIVLDGKSGAPLWHFQTGGNVASSPISYAVDGKQYLALTAGNAVYAFALPDRFGSR